MRLLVSGGGTGGHIYPALALIEEAKKKDPTTEVLYVGTKKGLESQIVPDAGIDFKTIEIQGFKRSLSLENFKTVYLFLKSISDSKKIIKEFKPDIVIGTGGYVCGSVVYAASRLHIPTVIHEQNSVAGVTNKFLSHFTNKVAIAFDDVRKDFPDEKIVFTGNPRAQQVAHMQKKNRLAQYGLNDEQPTVLIFGGSRGAEKINQSALEAAKNFTAKNYQVLFVTGRVHFDEIMKKAEKMDIPSNMVIKPYIPNMPEILPEIDLIVGRAGATSLAEITALGIPSILIPSPYVTADHQTKNAMSLVERNAAKIIKEQDLNGELLSKTIDSLMTNENERDEMAKNAYQMGVRDAADQLYSVLQDLI
ncbi:undecaprenyldiphospho-muramoylpentapeptide beta-N-acetylglucosaminyltransferase [Ligilactobacillus cholophilus]|uniref:undecaprenyldiphospho-muramoylpentapeptide beta-N-acetylglucosaminyltransferase n=1 Tax=Ligilactobacillus cholophilus TaxID=3050131 RepID=UPI0025AED068|nr:undecaprenyldiphospho-muramoylpentapeptide beta-N-acetylglucosaminyltransferase [Ligilactobacillus cholophilus]